MIGVAIPPQQHSAAREFFELCKTPWRFCASDELCDVLLCTSVPVGKTPARLTIVYAESDETSPLGRDAATVVTYAGHRLPLYAGVKVFVNSSDCLVLNEATGEPITSTQEASGYQTTCVGYNLFAEISTLLGKGQPVRFADCPTLELHITLLRNLILRAGLPFVEIPPVPSGFAFTACLTHDVDHPVLRNHRGDATMLGYVFRATVGSCLKAFQGKIPLTGLLRNWRAAAKLPFVYLGWAEDGWRGFDRYLAIEAGKPSTFFVIPKRGVPGRSMTGNAPAARGCKYALPEIKDVLEKITAGGAEVALHGIDAWCDSTTGSEERAALQTLARTNSAGVRMHWLYFDQGSPAQLESSGFTYDSTVGYNQTVGYRAGTTQVYRPFAVQRLLELPLHVMDTALFYPDYLNLREAAARKLTSNMIGNARLFGGVLTINWHDRSIAPERLWDEFYRVLLADLQLGNAWFATAGRTVAWFAMRRSLEFVAAQTSSGALHLRARFSRIDPTLPGLKVRVYKPQANSSSPSLVDEAEAFVELSLQNDTEITIKL